MIERMIGRLFYRVMLMIGRGTVSVVNDSGATQILQIRLGSDEIRDRTPRFAEYGFTSSPKIGAQAVAVFIGGERSDGAVIATDDPRYRPTGLLPGEAVIYDDQGQKVHITRTGINIVSSLAVTVDAPSIIFAGGGPAVARVGDTVTCPAGTGHITSGSSKVQSG